jgi:hypothetical protein
MYWSPEYLDVVYRMQLAFPELRGPQFEAPKKAKSPATDVWAVASPAEAKQFVTATSVRAHHA